MPQLDPRAVWPGWKTVKLIGKGSFGAVYEIEREVFGNVEKAALKYIPIPQNDSDIEELYDCGYDRESITDTYKSHLKSIVNEYSLMRKMSGSANVVNCDDFRVVQHDDGIGWDIFIKMELLMPLTRALDQSRIEEQTIRLAKDMCNALILCRKQGIIHRDIKPQNIFVSRNGDYKLGDFGIAKVVEKTSGGTKTGTFRYMAPEVYHARPYNHTVDIYSLGLVMYWMLNDYRQPFAPLPPASVTAGQEDESRERRFRGEPLPAPVHGSAGLKRIVLKACAYDSGNRYQSAEAMLQDLNALEEHTIGPAVYMNPIQQPSVAPLLPPQGTVGVWSGKGDSQVRSSAADVPPIQPSVPDDGRTVGVWYDSQGEPSQGAQFEGAYQNACRIALAAYSTAQFNEAAMAFDRLGDYKDSRARAAALRRKVWELNEAEKIRVQREGAYQRQRPQSWESSKIPQEKAGKKKTGLIILIICGAVFMTILGLIIGLGQSCNASKNQSSSTSSTRAHAETDVRRTTAPTAAADTRASTTKAPTTKASITQAPTKTKASETTAAPTTTTVSPTTTVAPTEMNKDFLGKWYGDLGSEFVLYADGKVVWKDGGADGNQLTGTWTLNTSTGRFVIDMYRDSDYKRFNLYTTLSKGYDSTTMKKMKANWSKTDSTLWYYESFYRKKPTIKTTKEQQPYP